MDTVQQTYDQLQKAYDFFNVELFEKKLPGVIFIFDRKGKRAGHYWGESWTNKKNKKLDEIGINPETFNRRSSQEILSTLVHEMVHHWQKHFGSLPKNTAYHNREWANKMISIGLIPSHTGKEGGKQIGLKMTHYIEKGGKFSALSNKFIKAQKFKLMWIGLPAEKKKSKPGRIKFECDECGLIAYAKPTAEITCTSCNLEMES